MLLPYLVHVADKVIVYLRDLDLCFTIWNVYCGIHTYLEKFIFNLLKNTTKEEHTGDNV